MRELNQHPFISGPIVASAATAALRHDCGMKPLAKLCRELVNFVLAVDGDGLARGVQHDFAMVAFAYVLLDFSKQFRVDLAVKVIGELAEKVCAGHGLAPPFFCRK